MANDEEMLKIWLKNQKEKSFENGIEAACKYILTFCYHKSAPVAFSCDDDTFYVSMDELKSAINLCKIHYDLV